MKAAEKVAGDIMAKAALQAKLDAKLEAKKEIDKLLNIQPLPVGANDTGNHSRYVEEIKIHDVIRQVIKSKKKISASFWRATGKLYTLTSLIDHKLFLFLYSFAYIDLELISAHQTHQLANLLRLISSNHISTLFILFKCNTARVTR